MESGQEGGLETMMEAQVPALYSSVYPCTAVSLNCTIITVQVQHMEPGQERGPETMMEAQVPAMYSSVYPCTAVSLNCTIITVQVQLIETGQEGVAGVNNVFSQEDDQEVQILQQEAEVGILNKYIDHQAEF